MELRRDVMPLDLINSPQNRSWLSYHQLHQTIFIDAARSLGHFLLMEPSQCQTIQWTVRVAVAIANLQRSDGTPQKSKSMTNAATFASKPWPRQWDFFQFCIWPWEDNCSFQTASWGIQSPFLQRLETNPEENHLQNFQRSLFGYCCLPRTSTKIHRCNWKTAQSHFSNSVFWWTANRMLITSNQTCSVHAPHN